jgi:large subunit ribosomal protein L15
LIIIFKRDTIVAVAGAVAYKLKSSKAPRGSVSVRDIETHLLSVDALKAEEMISDTVARLLVKKRETVRTRGRRRVIINVDTLCDNFSGGERVDINRMKEKGLIPNDAGYVKVLARGILDKPLTVVANDFSITAVKMIALTGGKAIKATTIRRS